MDKYQATKTLTEKLAEHFGRLVVSDEHYKQKLVKEAQHAYVIDNTINLFLERNYPELYYVKYSSDGKTKKDVNLEEVIKEFIPPEANYLFLCAETRLDDYKIIAQVTPYSIIGSKELDALKGLFYKKYDFDTKEALNTLGIKDFYKLYQSYFNNDPGFQNLLFNNFENFKKELLDFLKDCKYDGDGDTKLDAFESKFGILNLNSQFKKLNINFLIQIDGKYIRKSKIDELVRLLKEHNPPLSEEGHLSLGFLKFVFELPYEDQNIETNKFLLKKFGHFFDLKVLLFKEFKQGKYFKEYFELLEDDKQKEVVRLIKQGGFQNSDYNSFLWSKGFKDISLDYLKLYKENPEDFIDYFKHRNSEEKKIILKDVMDCDFTNEKAVDWLNEHEHDLIREVGLNG